MARWTARVPARASDDDRYFQDRFQAMPLHGYTPMFARIAGPSGDHGGDGDGLAGDGGAPCGACGVHRTGRCVFGLRFGPLPYRSLTFRHETHHVAQVQPVAVINEPDQAVPHTRTTEFKYLTGQEHAQTSLCVEFPTAEGDPYYPVPKPENQVLYRRYQALADATPGVSFVGRLATYRYYNMDQVVAQALATHRRMSGRVDREAVLAE